MTETPPPPTGVKITHQDGSVSMAEVEFAGYEDGVALWTILPVPNLRLGDHVSVDMLPAKTGVRFSMAIPEEDE